MSFQDFNKSLEDIRKTIGVDECYEKVRQLKSENEKLKNEIESLGSQFRYFLDKKEEVISEYKRLEITYNRKRYSLKEFDALVARKVKEELKEKIKEGLEERWERYKDEMFELAVLTEIRKYPNSCRPSVRKTIKFLLDNKSRNFRYVPAREDSQ